MPPSRKTIILAINDFIGKADIDRAMSIASKNADILDPQNTERFRDNINSLSSRLAKNNRDERMGIVSFDNSVMERNRVVNAFIELIGGDVEAVLIHKIPNKVKLAKEICRACNNVAFKIIEGKLSTTKAVELVCEGTRLIHNLLSENIPDIVYKEVEKFLKINE